MLKKTTALLLCFLPIGLLVQSCIYGDDTCGDLPESLPFFTYEAIELDAPPTIRLEQNFGGFLLVQADDVDFVAQQQPTVPLGWLNGRLLACSPLPDGYEGAKFPLDSVRMTSNRPYAPSRGIDRDLRTVMRDQQTNAGILQTPQFEPFTDQTLFWEFTLPPDTLFVPFRFEVELFRSDGTTLTATTGDIIWEE